jgi:hypothetical protein
MKMVPQILTGLCLSLSLTATPSANDAFASKYGLTINEYVNPSSADLRLSSIRRQADVTLDSPYNCSLPNPLVVEGETFTNPVYASHDASRLNITHKTGVASLPIIMLPNALKQKLEYNHAHAAIAEEALRERQERSMTQQHLERQKMIEREGEAEQKREAVARELTAAVLSNTTPSGVSTMVELSEAVIALDGMEFAQGSMGQWVPVRSSQPAMVPANIPEDWGGRPTGNSQRARQRRHEWDEQRALQIASQAGPEALQTYTEKRDAAKAQQDLQNLLTQQNLLRDQIQQMEWQQQQQRSEMQRIEWERQTEGLRSPW